MSNLFKEKLAGEKIGLIFGSFAPFHVKHLDLVTQAKRSQDGVVVVVSGSDGDRGDKIGLNLQKRFRYLREMYADDPLVYVAKLDETDLPAMPVGWKPWLQRVMELVDQAVLDRQAGLTFYVGEKVYQEELEKYPVMTNHAKISYRKREDSGLSASKIREFPLIYWPMITRPFRRHFSHNILITGAASGGKTTLVKDLARYFGSPFALEYARDYQEIYNVNDLELTTHDYIELIRGQWMRASKEINGTSNNGLVFADTDAITTYVYSSLEVDQERVNHQQLLSLYDETIARTKWDLILVVPPTTDYIDDHFRDMRGAKDQYRWDFHHKLIETYQAYGYGDKLVCLESSDSADRALVFLERYEQAKKVIIETFKLKSLWEEY